MSSSKSLSLEVELGRGLRTGLHCSPVCFIYPCPLVCWGLVFGGPFSHLFCTVVLGDRGRQQLFFSIEFFLLFLFWIRNSRMKWFVAENNLHKKEKLQHSFRKRTNSHWICCPITPCHSRVSGRVQSNPRNVSWKIPQQSTITSYFF